jgi:hypothetical protein
VDGQGLYTNTEDIDCEVCKGDLHLWAVVSEACPGRATCAEHPQALGAPPETLVLLYRCWASLSKGLGCLGLFWGFLVCVASHVLTGPSCINLLAKEVSCVAPHPRGRTLPRPVRLQGFRVLVEGLCVWGCTDLEVRGARRFTFEELQGFVERAKACIPGTADAVEAAARHRAHQVPALEDLCSGHI